jgi:hypothetical protein
VAGRFRNLIDPFYAHGEFGNILGELGDYSLGLVERDRERERIITVGLFSRAISELFAGNCANMATEYWNSALPR